MRIMSTSDELWSKLELLTVGDASMIVIEPLTSSIETSLTGENVSSPDAWNLL